MFKPLAGVLDLTTHTLKGIGNTASWLLDGPLKELTPVRPKRYIDRSGIVRTYDFKLSRAHDPRFEKAQKDANKAEKKSKQQQQQQQQSKATLEKQASVSTMPSAAVSSSSATTAPASAAK